MTIITNVPGIASSGVDWPVLPVVSSGFPMDGLASYLAVEGATMDTGGNVAALAKWYGTDALVQANTLTAPEIATVSGVDLLRFTRASSERLVSPPAPVGGALKDAAAGGFSVAFPMMLRDTTTSLQGIARIFGFGIRLVISGGTLLQIQEIVGTTTTTTVLWDFTQLAVLGLAYDDAAKNLKVYRDGVQVINSTSANWSYSPAEAMAYGAFFIGSDFGNVDAGDIARWTRQISGAEMLAASQFLMARFGI